jgi:hypothetical protein
MRKRKTARYDFPKINIPGLHLPKVDLPKVDLPRPKLPQVNLPKINLPLRQMLIAGFLVLLVLAMVSLNGRLREYSRLTGERDSLKSEVAVLQVTSQSLETQLAYALSEKAAEEYARNSHKIREGEKLVVVLTPQGNQAVTKPSSSIASEKPAQKWEVWWMLFFGNSPN